jgi:hypothetical protein
MTRPAGSDPSKSQVAVPEYEYEYEYEHQMGRSWARSFHGTHNPLGRCASVSTTPSTVIREPEP